MNAAENSFYVAGGTLRADAPCYVGRQADQDLFEALCQGEFAYVLTARQMGKSSLMVRTANRLRRQDIRVAILDLTAIGHNLTAEQWYDGLMAKLGQELGIEAEILDFWDAQARFGPLQRWMAALEKVILPRCPGRLVIFVDEIDLVRSLPFCADEFFAAIRECYNRRPRDPGFHRVTFCLLGVAAPTDLIRDVRMTPFNIGRRIELADFTLAQAGPLAQGLLAESSVGSNPATARRMDARSAEAALRRVLHWTGGHPYLTQRLCRAAASQGTTLGAAQIDRLCDELFLSPRARERDDNLVFVRERLLQSDGDVTELLTLYGRVWRGKRVADDQANPLVSVLRLAGLTRTENGSLRVRNRIYEHVFDRQWIEANLPGAELRRQRAAFRGGVRKATAGSLMALVALVVLASFQKPLNLASVLPDGSRLAVRGVTFGTFHRCVLGYWRLGWLRGLVNPDNAFRRWLDQLSPEFVTMFEQERLVVWITREPPPSGQSQVAVSNGQLLDEHGCEFATSGVGGGAAGPRSLVVLEFRSFPRRQKAFLLRLLDADGKPLAGFTVPSPLARDYPAWQPTPLPTTRRDGDLAVTLTAVKGSTAAPGPHSQQALLMPELQISEGGTPSREWEVHGLEVADATGNVGSLHTSHFGLCRFEPAIELRVGLIRSQPAQVPVGDVWTVTNIPVPRAGEFVPLNKHWWRRGVGLELTGVAGPGAVTNSSDIYIRLGQPQGGQREVFVAEGRVSIGLLTPDLPSVAFVMKNWPVSQALSLRATDPLGAVLPLTRSGAAGVIHGGVMSFGAVRAPPNLSAFDLSFIVQEARQFAFVVKPPAPARP